MVFAAAGWLVALIVPPLLWLLLKAADRRADRRATVLLGPQASAAREAWHARTRGWQRFFQLCGLCWLVLALARPQWGASEVTITQRGQDVVIALDVSRSMLAEDVAPNRLERAKAELTTFLRQHRDGRVGLVLFAGAAFVQAPLTGDLATAEVFLKMAAPDMISAQGTAIGTALRVSRELLQAGAGPDALPGFQAILLVTDGEDLEGGWELEAEACRRLGITVIPVGIGEATGGLIPITDAQGRAAGFLKDAEGNLVLTRLDLAALERLAAIGGGSAFRIGRDGLAGERLRAVLDNLGRRDFDDRRVTRHQERYQWPLGLALVHFCLAMGIAPRRRRHDAGDAVAGGVRPPAAAGPALLAWLVVTALSMAPPAMAQVLQPTWSAAMERGRAAYAAGDFETALQEFELARAQAPDEPRLALAVGEALFHLGRHEEAAQEFERARALSRDAELRAESRYNAGTTALAQGDAQQAVEHLRESLRLSPGQPDALHNLEAALRLQEQQQQQEQQEQQEQQQEQEQEQEQQQQQQDGEQQQQDGEQQQQDGEQQQQHRDQQQDSDADAPEQPRPDQTDQPSTPPDASEQPQPHDAAPEMDREQALQLLNALDRDEQELKRSIQQRLRGEGARSGRQW